MNDDFGDLCERFRAWLILDRGLAGTSIDAYLADLRDYDAWAARAGIDAAAADRGQLIEYLESLQERNLVTATLARRLVTLRLFWRWMTQEKLIPADVTAVMDSPRGSTGFGKSCSSRSASPISRYPWRRAPTTRWHC